MIKKLKDIRIYGLIFTIAATLFVIGLSTPFFIEERLQPYLYNAGIDSIGALNPLYAYKMISYSSRQADDKNL